MNYIILGLISAIFILIGIILYQSSIIDIKQLNTENMEETLELVSANSAIEVFEKEQEIIFSEKKGKIYEGSYNYTDGNYTVDF